MNKSNLICVKVYFTPEEFADVVANAEEAKIRPLGLKLQRLKPHGFSSETIMNTKYIAKFLKFLLKQWKETKAERVARLAELAVKRKALEEEARKLGTVIQ